MVEPDRAVDVQTELDETHFMTEVEQVLPQVQDEWTGKDLVGGAEMEIEASQGQEEIHLIDNSRNIIVEQSSGSMINNIREEDNEAVHLHDAQTGPLMHSFNKRTVTMDNDSHTMQQLNAGVHERSEDVGNIDCLKAIKSTSAKDLKIIQPGRRDASRLAMLHLVNDSRITATGVVVDSRVNQQEQRDSSRLVKLEYEGGRKTLLQESREDTREIHSENMDELRMIKHEEQNLSPGQTEENCASDLALSQDTGDGAEAFYRLNSDFTNGTSRSLPPYSMEDGDGTDEEQAAFVRELENFFKERSMEFKPPKFYGENLNCLKLWRAVTKLGGYEQVTSCKLWRQVGESFKPPKTCTTVSWSFRGFYEKALLEYERFKFGNSIGGNGNGNSNGNGGISMDNNAQTDVLLTVGGESQPCATQASGSGRARRDAAARAMQGWHSQRLLSNGEVGDPIVKDKNSVSLTKREKQLKSIGMLKRKKTSSLERAVKVARTKGANPQMDAMVVDVGPQADWVKVNVHKTRDCFEVYALVPGLLREEVRVQCDPAGRLVISGDPEQPDNPWGVTSFKKVISLPSRIDSHQTSAVVTLHGQLFVRVPFEQSD